MAMEKKIAANILAAQTKCIDDKVFGTMVLEIEGGKEQTDAAVAYLKQTPHIIVRRDSDHA